MEMRQPMQGGRENFAWTQRQKQGIALPLSSLGSRVGSFTVLTGLLKEGYGMNKVFLLPASRPFIADSGKQGKYTAKGAGGVRLRVRK